MAAAQMTLLGLQTALNSVNDDLFSGVILPDGVDLEILKNNILLKGADFEVMYADPFFMKDVFTLISKKWYRTFDKWVKALAIEYAPLENYDRQEDYTDTTDKNITTSASRDNGGTRTFNNTDARTADLTTTSTEDVSAYDSSGYQPSKKTTVEEDGTDTMAHTGTIDDEFGETSSGSEEEDNTFTHSGRIHGNVGVTTSQTMLESELKIAEWNLYEHITDVFLSETVIPIYS